MMDVRTHIIAKELFAIADTFNAYDDEKDDVEFIGMQYEVLQTMLDSYGKKIKNNELKLSDSVQTVHNRLKKMNGYQKKEFANFIIMSLEEHRVDTGKLSSRFIDELEKATGKSLYPSPWNTMSSRYDVMEK